MFSIIAQLAGIFLGALGVFAGAVELTKVFTGCSTDEAVAKIQNIFNGKTVVPLANDLGFYNELCQALQAVIGEKRYSDLAKIDAALCAAGHMPVIACGINSGLPYFAITVQPKDVTEKQVIETVMVGIARKYLVARGFRPEVIADWKVRLDINYPYLEIRYPENPQHQKMILDTIARDGIAVIGANGTLTDDTEDDDLTDDTEGDD